MSNAEQNLQYAKDVLATILAMCVTTQDIDLSAFVEHIQWLPYPHRKGLQLMLRGSGYGVDGLEADGDIGEKTTDSIIKLFEAAGR